MRGLRCGLCVEPISQNTWYTMKVELTGATVKVYWEGSLKITWTDGSPWYSGKVGVIVAADYMCAWDEFNAYTSPTQAVVAYDDYDPWGMVLEGRSGVSGNPDTRYKFTEKERDVETGLDYFGARYYDSRIGRWMTVDPLADKYPSLSTYCYVANNPARLVDPDGMEIVLDPNYRYSRFVNALLQRIQTVSIGKGLYNVLHAVREKIHIVYGIPTKGRQGDTRENRNQDDEAYEYTITLREEFIEALDGDEEEDVLIHEFGHVIETLIARMEGVEVSPGENCEIPETYKRMYKNQKKLQQQQKSRENKQRNKDRNASEDSAPAIIDVWADPGQMGQIQ